MGDLSALGGLTPGDWLAKYAPPASSVGLGYWPDPYACPGFSGVAEHSDLSSCGMWAASPVGGEGVLRGLDSRGNPWAIIEVGTPAWDTYLGLVALAQSDPMPDPTPIFDTSLLNLLDTLKPIGPSIQGATAVGAQSGSSQSTPLATKYAASVDQPGAASGDDQGKASDCWLCGLFSLPGRALSTLFPGVFCPCLADFVSQVVWFGVVAWAARWAYRRFYHQ